MHSLSLVTRRSTSNRAMPRAMWSFIIAVRQVTMAITTAVTTTTSGVYTPGMLPTIQVGLRRANRPDQDTFGVNFKVPLTDKNVDMGYIFHRGDTKDPGPDQFLDFGKWGFEVWQLEGADPEKPYILPILRAACSPEVT